MARQALSGLSRRAPPFNPAYPDRNVRTDTVYAAAGEVLRAIDTLGRTTVSCYDSQGRVIKTVQNPRSATRAGRTRTAPRPTSISSRSQPMTAWATRSR